MIKGKAIKRIVSPIQRTDLGGGIDSVMKLVGELTYLKQSITATFDAKMEELDNAIAHAMDIQKGEQGDPGIDADEQKIADWVLSQIRQPKDGISPDPEELVTEVLSRLPKLPNEKEFIAKILSLIPENKPSLKVIQEAIDKEALIEELIKSPKLKLKMESIDGLDLKLKDLDRRYIHGGGDTVSAGTNITITNVNGTKQISSTGGSGAFTPVAVTPTPDDTTLIYTAASSITAVNVNGSIYIDGTEAMGGTISIVGTTITLPNPIGAGGFTFGIA